MYIWSICSYAGIFEKPKVPPHNCFVTNRMNYIKVTHDNTFITTLVSMFLFVFPL